jgi:DNA-binding IclR family transcriptional regulator
LKRRFIEPLPAAETAPRPTLATLDKLVELLDAFSPERPVWALNELASRLGWDKATTHRFVTKLVALSVLERDGAGSYSLGTFPLALSARSLGANPVRRRLRTAMRAIAARTGLTTQVGFLDGAEIVIALSEEGTMLVNAAARLGARLPVHATAIGTAVLAQLDDDDVAELVPEVLDVLTERTIATRPRLLAELAAVRASGVAHAWSELAEGLDAVAVPLPRAVLGAVAAIGCAGPSADAPLKRDIVETALRDAAADLRLFAI